MSNNMRLINANDITYCNYDLDNYHSFRAVTDDEIAEMPTIEAVEVVHARWELEYESYGVMRCSVCKRECPLEKVPKPKYNWREELLYIASDYCPYCGAKMDKE